MRTAKDGVRTLPRPLNEALPGPLRTASNTYRDRGQISPGDAVGALMSGVEVARRRAVAQLPASGEFQEQVEGGPAPIQWTPDVRRRTWSP